MQDFTDHRAFAAEIRLKIVETIGARGFGHIGGSLSIADVLAVLYGGVMRVDPDDPKDEDRDKLVLSKGHAGPALYSALALRGFFPEDWLNTLNRPDTHLPSHCDRNLTPGVDMTTGSLGQGVSTAIGLALAQKLRGQKSFTYLITGDGELEEGQCWEGALFAPAHRLGNLVWFVDYNKKQLDGPVDDIIPLGDIANKFASFGWDAVNIDGGDTQQIEDAIKAAKAKKDVPSCIVLNTVKGAGVKCVSSLEMNHHINLDGDLLEEALAECRLAVEALEGGGAA
jgi:transketolase